ncbi:TRAP transporter substrate-binding protein, partial [Salmonella enterica subsp. enterica serovar Enteritidis]|nr:TRAP transporter substrate-binding protein [Salmonella enterica subsp. enterica serovar Enteritidis]ECN6376837.1 TRAP transporter substrate-binding protein [Salmonella enterica subsp. enterica serovar Enteritidis]
AVKDFNVEFYEIDKKPFQEAVQPIYDGLKNKPRLYGLYQRIQTAKN